MWQRSNTVWSSFWKVFNLNIKARRTIHFCRSFFFLIYSRLFRFGTLSVGFSEPLVSFWCSPRIGELECLILKIFCKIVVAECRLPVIQQSALLQLCSMWASGKLKKKHGVNKPVSLWERENWLVPKHWLYKSLPELLSLELSMLDLIVCICVPYFAFYIMLRETQYCVDLQAVSILLWPSVKDLFCLSKCHLH